MWQTMETAQKDGTRILVVDSDGFISVVEWLHKHGGFWIACAGQDTIELDQGDWIVDPTHWMPLPELP